MGRGAFFAGGQGGLRAEAQMTVPMTQVLPDSHPPPTSLPLLMVRGTAPWFVQGNKGFAFRPVAGSAGALCSVPSGLLQPNLAVEIGHQGF